jgi:hypothetical protein
MRLQTGRFSLHDIEHDIEQKKCDTFYVCTTVLSPATHVEANINITQSTK